MANQGTSTGVQAAIAAADENFMAAFNRGDAAELADLYTENGQLLPTGSDFVIGKEAIQTFWQGAIDMGIKTARLETVEAVLLNKGQTLISFLWPAQNPELLKQLTESGATDTYKVVLGRPLSQKPTADVTINLNNTDGQLTAVDDANGS